MAKLIMTPQRRVILEALRDSVDHPTADELYDRVRRRIPRISLGTVYRNLEVLASSGMIGRMDVSGSPRRFDGNPIQHHHLQCLRCGRIVDAPFGPFRELDGLLGEENSAGYRITGYRLEFTGLCAACRQADRTAQTG